MFTKVVVSLVVAVCAIDCGSRPPVRAFFASNGYSYPLHVNLPASAEPTIVCPGCPNPERPGAEYEQLFVDGRQFLSTRLSIEFLQPMAPEADGFLVSNAFLFEDPPGAAVQLAVNLSAFSNAAGDDGEHHMPHEVHTTKEGEVLELRNILLLRHTGDDWEYDGWVY